MELTGGFRLVLFQGLHPSCVPCSSYVPSSMNTLYLSVKKNLQSGPGNEASFMNVDKTAAFAAYCQLLSQANMSLGPRLE